MGDFNFIETKIKDLYIIEPRLFKDNRGFFLESYNKNDFDKFGISINFVQDNESQSKKGVLRGMHFQTEYPQGKLVRVSQGEVYDVAVDMRKDSKTYGMWEGVVLSSENKKQLYIPEGFAHGFLVISDTAVLNYKCSNYYMPQYDCGFIWNDEDIDIKWPLEEIDELIMSDRDKNQMLFKEVERMVF